jgi:hypothetical protein
MCRYKKLRLYFCALSWTMSLSRWFIYIYTEKSICTVVFKLQIYLIEHFFESEDAFFVDAKKKKRKRPCHLFM